MRPLCSNAHCSVVILNPLPSNELLSYLCFPGRGPDLHEGRTDQQPTLIPLCYLIQRTVLSFFFISSREPGLQEGLVDQQEDAVQTSHPAQAS